MSCDVVVVGAGIIGCASADELSRRGHRVVLLDGRTIGAGATQASAGILAPYIEGHDLTPLLELAARSLAMYDTFVARARAESGAALDYQRTGTLEIALDLSQSARLREQERRIRESRIGCRWLSRAEVRDLEPAVSADIEGGFLVEPHGFVSALDLSLALVKAATSRGMVLATGAPVRVITQNGNALRVDTDTGSFVAPTVVFAAGSWSGQIALDGVAPIPVRPIRGQLLALARLTGSIGRVIWGPDCYLVPRAEGRVLVGATAEDVGFDERVTVTGVRDLLESACDLVPELWQASFEGARVGLRPATPDEMPIIGRSDKLPGLVYATGHFRNGVLLAPLTAALVGDLVEGNLSDAALRHTRPQRFGEL
ncbi:MAG: glycine oxidase ThiO [Acidobacteria bacterium]|nr:glycine oxidase ThiO [Acidobacteriota bacterium]MBI3262704.1 glycine oxidase ThiO [Acidobacteriota bacterium]